MGQILTTAINWMARLALLHSETLLPQPTRNCNNRPQAALPRETGCVFNSSLHGGSRKGGVLIISCAARLPER